MIKRTNKVFEAVVNKGLAVAKLKDTPTAIKMMMKAGVPKEVIDRVLKDSAHRATDWR